MGSAAQRVRDQVAFLFGVDQDHDRLLGALIDGIAEGIQRPQDVGYGTDLVSGDRVLTDPRVAPAWALPHAALYTGGVMPPRPAGMTDAAYEAYAREAVVQPFGALRGSAEALRIIARQYLTGDRDVTVLERYQDDPYVTVIVTRPAETPDPAALEAAVNDSAVVLAGGKVVLVVADYVTWQELAAAGTSWQDLSSVSWQSLSDGTFTP